jgi:hypothetical protein
MTSAQRAPRSRRLRSRRAPHNPRDPAPHKQVRLCYLEATGAGYIVSRLSASGMHSEPPDSVPEFVP